MTAPPAQPEVLDGSALRRVFSTASGYLSDSSRAINAINVYPVPDGDTGSNMAATFREATIRAEALPGEPDVPAVLAAIARGALYGARGNSGVILSQALRGFAAGAGQRDKLDGHGMARGLFEAAEQAYRAVSQPQEGTMLTVLRAAGVAANEAVARLGQEATGGGCVAVLEAAVAAAEQAEAETMNQLEVLREAGVPDAGGEGVCAILRGLLGAIGGDIPAVRYVAVDALSEMGAGEEHDGFGFCTEFLLEAGEGVLDPGRIRGMVEASGANSVVVVGDAEFVRVHAHTFAPEPLVGAAAAFGKVSRVKVEDMSAQHGRYRVSGSGAGAAVAVLALSHGPGFDRIFESLGAAVEDLGVVEKPAAGRIAEAADALHTPDVLILSNHGNVILAADQAKALARATVHLVPTRSLAQGVTALMAFNREKPALWNADAMLRAAEGVRTVEVTIAATTRRSGGLEIEEGDAIALLDGELVARAARLEDALIAGIQGAAPPAGVLVTVYRGEGAPADDSRLAARMAEAFPGIDLEIIDGGQPLYAYITSIE